jgi:alpha-1,2-mannosyltransferase
VVPSTDGSQTQAPQSPYLHAVPRWLLPPVALVAWAASVFYVVKWGRKWDVDLRVYHLAGHALFAGRSPYVMHFTVAHLPYTYPPFGLLVTSLLGFGSMTLVDVYFWILNAAATVLALYLALRLRALSRGGETWLLAVTLAGVGTLLLEPVRSNIDFGQINMILFAMVLIDVTCVRSSRRGVLIGVAAAIKLTPIVFLVYLLVRRELRAACIAVVTFVAADVLSLLIIPSESIHYWAHDALDTTRAGRLSYASNQSWAGVLYRAGLHRSTLETVLWLGLALVTLVVGSALAYRLCAKGHYLDALVAVALIGVLIGPISWTHHWSWIVVLPVVCLFPAMRDRVVQGVALTVMLIAVIQPYWWPLRGWVSDVTLDSLTLAGALLLGVWTFRLRSPVRPRVRDREPALA